MHSRRDYAMEKGEWLPLEEEMWQIADEYQSTGKPKQELPRGSIMMTLFLLWWTLVLCNRFRTSLALNPRPCTSFTCLQVSHNPTHSAQWHGTVTGWGCVNLITSLQSPVFACQLISWTQVKVC
jgi:hypothetical protein